MSSLLTRHQALALIDESEQPTADLLDPFAKTDALLRQAGTEKLPVLHFWTSRPSVILGMSDTRLLDFPQAVSQMKEQTTYDVMLRNSGGLGIVSDEQILNVTIVAPLPESGLTIHEAFEEVASWIARGLSTLGLTVTVGEVPDSYCPGKYDLSVGGKKIAGLAQRRLDRGVAVMLYLSVGGDQNKRAQVMQEFYRAGRAADTGRHTFPTVNPPVMTTLSDALGEPITPAHVRDLLLDGLPGTHPLPMTDSFLDHYQTAYQKMATRQARFLP